MVLPRYAALDAYTFEELKREYASLNPRSRVALLTALKEKWELSSRIEELALDDESAEVRQWIALNLQLSEAQVAKIRSAADEFVNACLWEGPTFGDWTSSSEGWIGWFKEAPHLERLAMMRNGRVDDTLVEMVFDGDDIHLGISENERRELIVAVLSNGGALRPPIAAETSYSEFEELTGGVDAGDYIAISKESKEHFAKLWQFAARWPDKSGVPYQVYLRVPADNDTKVKHYQAARNPLLRGAILTNDTPEFDASGVDAFGPGEVFELGLKDEDEQCRQVAGRRWAKIGPVLSSKAKIRSYSRIAWRVAVNLAILGLAYASFSTASTPFETVLLSLVLLLCGVTREWIACDSVYSERQGFAAGAMNSRLLELLKDPKHRKEEVERLLKERSFDLIQRSHLMLVDQLGSWPVYLLALYKMIVALLA